MSYTDEQRREFLQALDRADFEVSDWEAEFLKSNLKREDFSYNQRAVIDSLIERYAARLKWP